MRQYLALQVSGIKCDNVVCDYKDDTVDSSNYVFYVDRPCPLCGDNLLTKEDFDQVIRMQVKVKLFNDVMHKLRWLNPMFYVNNLIRRYMGNQGYTDVKLWSRESKKKKV